MTLTAVPKSSAGLATRLAQLLRDIAIDVGEEFTGTGLIVSDQPASLPIMSLRGPSTRWEGDARSIVGGISVASSEYHDGFHVVGSRFDVISLSQYFFPPTWPIANTGRLHIGSRYLTGLFGSALPDVSAVGIASRQFGVHVFLKGAEYLHRGLE